MRVLSIGLILSVLAAVVGCGKAPSSPAADSEYVIALKRFEQSAAKGFGAVEKKVDTHSRSIGELKQSVDRLAAAPAAPLIVPASKEQVDGSVKAIGESIKAMLARLETLGTTIQQNTEQIKATEDMQDSRLRNIEAAVENVDKNSSDLLEQFEAIKALIVAPSSPVPKTSPKPAPAAPPPDISDRKVAAIRIDGEYVPITDFIAKWYRGMWTHRGSRIDEHLLGTHHVDPRVLDMLDSQTKEKLHSAIHEHDLADNRRSVTKSRTETKTVTPAPAAAAPAKPAGPSTIQNCPNGRCPLLNPAPAAPLPVATYQHETRREVVRKAKGK